MSSDLDTSNACCNHPLSFSSLLFVTSATDHGDTPRRHVLSPLAFPKIGLVLLTRTNYFLTMIYHPFIILPLLVTTSSFSFLLVIQLLASTAITTDAFFVSRNVLKLRTIPTDPPSFSSSSSSSSSSSLLSSSSPFWNDEELVYDTILEDPPPIDILKEIQDQPWKGGLEPSFPISGGPATVTTLKITHGSIPFDMNGILCRNGPGRIRVGSHKYGHWFDGDGLVTKLTLNGSTQHATYTAKYVPTTKFIQQQQQQQQQQQEATKNKNKDDKKQIHFPPFAKAGAWTKRGNGNWWENIFQFPENPANTNILFVPTRTMNEKEDTTESGLGGVKLFALAEGGTPIELDINTLDAVHKNMDGSAIPVERLTTTTNVPKQKDENDNNNHHQDQTFQGFFSAHYIQDPITKYIYNHGLQLGISPTINCMKFNQYGESIQKHVSTKLPFSCFVHDFIQTQHYLIILLPPYYQQSYELIDALRGSTAFGKTYQWNPTTTNGDTDTVVAMIFSKETLECVGKIPLPLFSFYHFIDAYETTTTTTSATDSNNNNTKDEIMIHVRTMVHDGPVETIRTQVEECFADMYGSCEIPLCRMMEYQMNLSSQQFVSSHDLTAAAAAATTIPTKATAKGEFPETNKGWPSYEKKRFVYLNTRQDNVDYLDSIQKICFDNDKESSDIISFGKGIYAGAPIFVPKQQEQQKQQDAAELEEDDGYIVTQLYNSNTHGSDICILDAKTMSILTMLRLEYPVPYQFHGAWWPMM